MPDQVAEPRMQVTVRLFGAFRDCAPGGELELTVPRGITVAALRGHLDAAIGRACPSFTRRDLVRSSVLASDTEILDESAALGLGAGRVALAVLPPVCGG